MAIAWRPSPAISTPVSGLRARAARTLAAMTHDSTGDRAPAGPGTGARLAGGRRRLGPRRADDWACLYEHYAIDVMTAMFDRLGVGPDTDAARRRLRFRARARLATRTGATVAGIDAAEPLVADRPRPHPDGRPPGRLDVRAALAPTRRSTPPSRSTGSGAAARRRSSRRTGCSGPAACSASASGARGRRSTSGPVFKVFAGHCRRRTPRGDAAAQRHRRPRRRRVDAGRRRLRRLERGRRISMIEWPDADIAWRALRAPGPPCPRCDTPTPRCCAARCWPLDPAATTAASTGSATTTSSSSPAGPADPGGRLTTTPGSARSGRAFPGTARPPRRRRAVPRPVPAWALRPLVQHVAAVGDLQATPGVLLDHDHRHAGLVDRADPRERLVLGDRRQPRGRLVEEQHLRLPSSAPVPWRPPGAPHPTGNLRAGCAAAPAAGRARRRPASAPGSAWGRW